MPKKLPFFFLLCLTLTACCVPTKLPQINNSMAWSWGSKVAFHGDKDFTPDERAAISLACAQWTSFTHGGIVCSVTFGRDFVKQPFTGEADDFAIVKSSSLELWELAGVDPRTILGYAPHRHNPLTGDRMGVVMIASDNVTHGDCWNHVAKHEIGHILGFNHIDQYNERPNVMHATYSPETGNSGTTDGFGVDDLTECMQLGLCKN